MKKTELVWRELVDAAVVDGLRRWDNVDDLAFRAGVVPATASYALRRLVEIGAIQQRHAGFSVVNPEKVLVSSCAARSVMTDALAVATMSDSALERTLAELPLGSVILGGPQAAIELLGGVNTVSDYSERVIYLRDAEAAALLAGLTSSGPAETFHTGYGRDRGNVTFLLADGRAARKWRGHTSFAQTYVDLFATPGWQASEFRLALHERFMGTRDWDQN